MSIIQCQCLLPFGFSFTVQYSLKDQVSSNSMEDNVIDEAEDEMKTLNTVPEGMEVYDTMDTASANDDIPIGNGVLDAST